MYKSKQYKELECKIPKEHAGLFYKLLEVDRATTLTLLRERVEGLMEVTTGLDDALDIQEVFGHNNALDQALQVIEETLTPNTPD